MKRLFKQLLKYIFLPIGAAIGLVAAILYLTQEIKESPRYIRRHAFPADSLFIDLDKITMAKKAKVIDSVFSTMQIKAGFNGCVLYGEKGRLVFKKAYGYDDFKTKKRLTVSSAFQLASVSKMFTAMAIMILKEEGLLDYDDSVRQYIPELPYPGITIRHLLNHRSGLPDYMHFSDNYWDQTKPLTNEDMIRIMADYQPPRYFSAGNGFDYCNSNYALLASVVERITKKPFDQFIREKIFDPLDMGDSFIYHLEEGKKIPQYVQVGIAGHRPSRGMPREELNHYQNGVVGDKGVYTTVEDLFKWDQALYKSLLVSETTLNEAYTEGSPRFSKWRDNYGFGWRIKAVRVNTVYHFGWWKGFRSYFIRDLDQEKTIIVLTNTTRSLSSGALYDVLDDKKYELGPICPYSPTGKVKRRIIN
ncbi:MAG: beta-lactamase family protein [Bacteroidales bacterium]|nr:beta-lactamase family protein [Bacteroidales bacterium]